MSAVSARSPARLVHQVERTRDTVAAKRDPERHGLRMRPQKYLVSETAGQHQIRPLCHDAPKTRSRTPAPSPPRFAPPAPSASSDDGTVPPDVRSVFRSAGLVCRRWSPSVSPLRRRPAVPPGSAPVAPAERGRPDARQPQYGARCGIPPQGGDAALSRRSRSGVHLAAECAARVRAFTPPNQ